MVAVMNTWQSTEKREENGEARSGSAARNIQWEELSDVTHLANGAMASCYTATLNGRTVVVKRPRKGAKEPMSEIARQINLERHLLRTLEHRNIIKLIGYGVHQGAPFLVVEHLPGGTLAAYLASYKKAHQGFIPMLSKPHLPMSEVLEKAAELAQALRYLHDEASQTTLFIYRDLKPENIGFAADGRLVLFDFGLVRAVPRSRRNANGHYRLTGQTGTCRYMAPEVYTSNGYNELADVYGWSHIVAEMTCLAKPYAGFTVADYEEKVVGQEERPKLGSHTPKPLRRLLQRCWATCPDDRPSFASALGALEIMLREQQHREHSRPNSRFEHANRSGNSSSNNSPRHRVLAATLPAALKSGNGNSISTMATLAPVSTTAASLDSVGGGSSGPANGNGNSGVVSSPLHLRLKTLFRRPMLRLVS